LRLPQVRPVPSELDWSAFWKEMDRVFCPQSPSQGRQHTKPLLQYLRRQESLLSNPIPGESNTVQTLPHRAGDETKPQPTEPAAMIGKNRAKEKVCVPVLESSAVLGNQIESAQIDVKVQAELAENAAGAVAENLRAEFATASKVREPVNDQKPESVLSNLEAQTELAKLGEDTAGRQAKDEDSSGESPSSIPKGVDTPTVDIKDPGDAARLQSQQNGVVPNGER
jgi:hypothetical protein